jgi:hypothetical protein
VLLVVVVRLPATILVLFLIGGALIGAGAGAVYKGTTGLVLEATEPENRVAMTSPLVIAVFAGLSVPVIGAGVALTQGASPPDAMLGFAILVALGISVSGWAILGRRSTGRSKPQIYRICTPELISVRTLMAVQIGGSARVLP